MTPAPNTRLGRYEIRSKLGEGGMGEVYAARDPKLGRDVAIKVLPDQFSADKERLARFEQEARAAGRPGSSEPPLSPRRGHPNGSLYVVSELLQGETLRQKMNAAVIPQRKVID